MTDQDVRTRNASASEDRPEYDAMLLYDGDYQFCPAATTALRRVPDFGAVTWEDEATRTFHELPFGKTPFVLILTDGSEERLGPAAPPRVSCVHGPVFPRWSGRCRRQLESFSAGIRRVSGDRKSDPYHNTYPMDRRCPRFFHAEGCEFDQNPPPRD